MARAGTLKGVARVLKKERPDTQVVVCEPDNVPILSSGIPQPRTSDGAPLEAIRAFRPHIMQGWTPDFIPKLTEDAVAAKLVDRVLPVNGADALRCSRELAQKEGIFVGITAGATFSGALRVCEEAPPGANVLCMLPDTAERYLSTPLFADVPAEMTDEELAIARSTPNYRFDVSAPAPAPAAAAAAPPPAVEADAAAFVAQVVSDREQPVVMFALEWCEFCWSVRRLFAKYQIAYRSIDLDSVEYQQGDRGGKVRAALTARTQVATIPQIFVGGELLGGATDVLQAAKEGRLQKLLASSGVAFDPAVGEMPLSFLPGWLHPR
jgi:cysteine synthase A